MLQEIATGYLFTSVGDQAANRLGDLAYVRRDLKQATMAWRAILDYRPDSAIPRAQLLAKIAQALGKSKSWKQYDAVRQELIQHYTNELVLLDDQELTASQQIERLEKEFHRTSSASERSAALNLADDLDLSSALPTAWQFSFHWPQNIDWQFVGSVPLDDVLPCVITGRGRIYVNYLGYGAALDQRTGKLLWSDENPPDLRSRVEISRYTSPLRHTAAAAETALFSVARTGPAFDKQQQPFSLMCVEPQSGSSIWTSNRLAQLKPFDCVGVPVILGNRLYVAAEAIGKLRVLAIDPRSGQLLWSTPLGSDHVPDPRMSFVRDAQPVIIATDDHIYVETNNGAVVALNPRNGAVQWAFVYEAEPRTPNAESSPINNAPLYVDGTLYTKGLRSSYVYILDVVSPKLLRKLAVTKATMLHSVGNNRVLLSDMDLKSMDLATGEVKWSSPLPNRGPFAQPLESRSQILFFTSRGIVAYDRDSGQQLATLPGEDRSSRGGTILRTDDHLITVSNRAITAYSIAPLTERALE